MKNTVFISYVREDKRYAERLYMDLRKADINAWLDTKCLLAGQNWKKEIRNTIRESAFFIALISEFSLNKRGYAQSEIKIALDVLKEIPSNQIFLIPVKLDKSMPYDEELLDLSWINLYESYGSGLNRILSIISKIEKEPLVFYTPKMPYGERAPIQYSPFSSFEEFVLDILSKFPTSAEFYDSSNHSFYIACSTTFQGVEMPKYLLDKYPDEILLVFQYQFKNIHVNKDLFIVDLSFDGVIETLAIPYAAVRRLYLPTIDVAIVNTKGM